MDAAEIIRRWDSMFSDRSVWESHWKEVAQVVLPRSDWFQGGSRTPGEKKTQLLFDSTATLALDRFAAAMESMLVPRTQVWHGLRARAREVAEDQSVKQWLEEVVEILFRERYSPTANFASQANDVFMSLGAFGTGAMFVDEARQRNGTRRGMRYRSVHLSELCISENHQGVIDTVFRKMTMTARQITERFGLEGLSDKVKTHAEKRPDQPYEVIHAVYPNAGRVAGKLNYKGMPWASCYVLVDSAIKLEEGGFRSFPYAVGRYVTGPKETYGRSPAMSVLPEIKTVNQMAGTLLRAGEKALDPPLLLQEDGALSAFDLRPGALNFGGVNDQGNPVVHPLQFSGQIGIGEDMLERRRQAINDTFLVTLFQILVQAPSMTATEAMLRAQEKGQLLAPTMGRQQSEFLGPLIERELDLLWHQGVFPPMPDALVQAGGLLDVEYSSPLNKAQRAEEGVAIMRTLESVTPLAQSDPKVMRKFNLPEIAVELATINGMPQKLMRTDEEMQAMDQQAAQAQQAQQLLAAAPVVSSSIKNLSQAQALAAAAPSQQAPNIFG